MNFEALYEQYFTDVYRYALTLCCSESEAEELTQETFFKALQSIDRFKGECRVYVWLCQIAKNTWFTAAKRQRRLVPEESVPEQCAPEQPEQTVLEREAGFEAQSALHRLPEPYREVVMLRTMGEVPFARIGQLFGKTESWARVTYHRGRTKLKEML